MYQPILAAVVLAFVSAVVHALGLLGLLYWLTRQWTRIETDFRPRRNLPVFLLLFGVILGLHLVEIGAWAGVYFQQHCLPDFETSFYFSAASFTTVGYGDVVLARPWRMAGALESLTGVLLLGWSAAFFFGVVSRLFDLRIQKWRGDTK
ncbi:MAG: potassium channel family protein [Limisphaerales bacterium]